MLHLLRERAGLARCAENATHGENSGVTHGRTEQAGDGRDNDIEKTYHASPLCHRPE